MGWVMTPAHGNEPARSPPQVAMHLEKVYQIYLERFEFWSQQIMARQRQLQQQQQQQGKLQAAIQHANSQGGQHQPNAQMNGTHVQGAQVQAGNFAQLLSMSSDKLRAAGHSEQVVQAIESHRNDALQQQQQQQQQRQIQQQQQVRQQQQFLQQHSQQQQHSVPQQIAGQMSPHAQQAQQIMQFQQQQLQRQQQLQSEGQAPPMQGLLSSQATQAQANQQAGNGMQVNMAMSSRLSKPTPEQLKNSHMLVQRWRDEALVKLSKTPICFYRGHV